MFSLTEPKNRLCSIGPKICFPQAEAPFNLPTTIVQPYNPTSRQRNLNCKNILGPTVRKPTSGSSFSSLRQRTVKFGPQRLQKPRTDLFIMYVNQNTHFIPALHKNDSHQSLLLSERTSYQTTCIVMSSRSASPELTRRSKLPIPSRHASPQQTQTTPYAPRLLLSSRPPSPPQSPDPAQTPPAPSPTKNIKNVHWGCPENENHGTTTPNERRPLERRESTDSMRENERFSPIPWIMSPPGSPPPLSLYTSVALLHYHIHQAPSTSSTPNLQPQVASHSLDNATPLPDQNCSSPLLSRTTSASNSPEGTITRKSRIVSAEKALEEFLAVERAFKESPYSMPDESLAPKTNDELVNPITGTTDTTTSPNLGNTQDAISHKSASSESERDCIVELVEGYSLHEEEEIGSTQSSPFVVHTKPCLPVSDHDASSAAPRLDLPPLSNDPTSNPDNKTDNEVTEQSMQPEDTLNIPIIINQKPTISRTPSIRRRGQEYLTQFLAKRKSQIPPPSKPSPPSTTPNTKISPMIFLLCLFVFLSLLGNIFLVAKVLQLQSVQSPGMRLDSVMKPGKVGETFEIFTTQHSNWWNWRPAKEKENKMVAIPASPARIHKVAGQKWAFAKVWERYSVVESSGNSGVKLDFAESLSDLFGRTRVFINGMWTRIFRI